MPDKRWYTGPDHLDDWNNNAPHWVDHLLPIRRRPTEKEVVEILEQAFNAGMENASDGGARHMELTRDAIGAMR